MEENEKILKLKVAGENVFLSQRKDMFCVSLDTVLLVEFVKLKRTTKTVIDFGTNNGAIAILLAKKYKEVAILGIEIQEEAVKLATENVVTNNLEDRIKILNQDIKKYAAENENNYQKKVDVIVCNPPFFPIENEKTRLKLQPLKIAARHELHIDLQGIISSAAKLLKVKGKFFIIYDIQRIDLLFSLLKENNLMIKKIQFVFPKLDKSANLVLIEASNQTSQGLEVMPPLICHNDDGSYNDVIDKWYNKEK